MQFNLILASQSPRRSQLLKEAGFTNIIVRPTDTDETIPEGMKTTRVAAYLAEKKAKAAKHLLKNDEIIVAADTIVILEGIIFGKPTDYNDAFKMIRALSGKMHLVITGVCLMSKNKKITFSDTAKVHFDEFTDQEIDYYINTCKPYDKAGSYGIQEWLGLCKINKIIGTTPTIMGLPVNKIYKNLNKGGW
jgi:septum formation protein